MMKTNVESVEAAVPTEKTAEPKFSPLAFCRQRELGGVETVIGTSPEQVEYLISRGWVVEDEFRAPERARQQAERESAAEVEKQAAVERAEKERQEAEQAAENERQRKIAEREAAELAERRAVYDKKVDWLFSLAVPERNRLENRARDISDTLIDLKRQLGQNGVWSDEHDSLARQAIDLHAERGRIQKKILEVENQLAEDVAQVPRDF